MERDIDSRILEEFVSESEQVVFHFCICSSNLFQPECRNIGIYFNSPKTVISCPEMTNYEGRKKMKRRLDESENGTKESQNEEELFDHQCSNLTSSNYPQKRTKPLETEEQKTENEFWSMSDVEVFINITLQTANTSYYPFVFYHQLYHQLSLNRSFVHSDLIVLRKSKSYKFLYYGHLVQGYSNFFGTTSISTSSEPIVLVPTSFYMETLKKFLEEKNESSLTVKMESLILDSDQLSFSHSQLLSLNITEEEIQFLNQNGFLTFRENILANSSSLFIENKKVIKSENYYWLSHPLLGKVIQMIVHIESLILQCIKRKKYKEIPEKELTKLFHQVTSASVNPFEKRKLTSYFSLKYHLLDLLGRNKVHEIASPLANHGNIYRLVN
jgi:hypothetical protein